MYRQSGARDNRALGTPDLVGLREASAMRTGVFDNA
jgi:hypothetical protein